MPFNSALSAPQATLLRTNQHAVEAYMLVTPNDIVWQAQVNSLTGGLNYAAFLWDTTEEGDRTDVKVGHRVMVTATKTDFTSPVMDSVIRGQVPDATSVYVTETGQVINTSMFVTVFDTYPLKEKLGRITSSTTFKDYDLAYQDLPHEISGLQTVYADLSGSATFVQAFAPVITAVASGDTLASVLWDIGDGSYTVGDATTQSITASFPNTLEHRWVSLTATGTNGVSRTYRFQVYTADRFSASSVVKLDYGNLTVTGNLDNGWSGSVEAWASFDANTVLDHTRVAIVTRELYDLQGTPDNTPMLSNVALVGELSAETNTATGDQLFSETQGTNLTITGLGTRLAALKANRQNIADVDSPAAWGDITDPTPTRVVMQHLAYDTTALMVLPLESEDLTGYVFQGDALHLLGKTVGENIDRTLEAVNGQLVTAPDGTVGLYRNANYQPSATRDTLVTVLDWDYASQDYNSIDDLSDDYAPTAAQASAVGAVYNTTEKSVAVFEAQAPVTAYGDGYTTADLPGQILADDSDVDAGIAEIKQRCANHFAYVNGKWIFSATLPSGYWFFVPAFHQWHTHTIPATANPRARAFTSATRWVLNEINITFTGETADVTGAWFIETENTGASTVGRQVPIVGETNYFPPPISPFATFPDDPLALYATDDPTNFVSTASIAAQEPANNYPPGHNDQAPVSGEILNVNMLTGATVSTTRDTVLGETYIVEVDGDGVVASGWAGAWDFSITNGEFAQYVAVDGESYGVYVANWIQSWSGTNNTGCAVERDFDVDTTLTYAAMQYFHTNSGVWDGTSNHQNLIHVRGVGATTLVGVLAQTDPTDTTPPPELLEWAGTAAVTTGSSIAFAVQSARKFGGTGELGDVTILSLALEGTGNPPFGFAAGDRGDAFYRGYDTDAGATLYASSDGLQIDLARPSGIPPFSGSHVYRFFATGTGNPFDFKFLDGDYTDNDNNILRVAITGPNMGLTA